jgi:hypothetical protein
MNYDREQGEVVKLMYRISEYCIYCCRYMKKFVVMGIRDEV